MTEQESRRGGELAAREDATRVGSFDELAKGLANGNLSHHRALRMFGAALLGGALAFSPGVALAAPCPSGRIRCRGECCPENVTTCQGRGSNKTCGPAAYPATCCCGCHYHKIESPHDPATTIATCGTVTASNPTTGAAQCELDCANNIPDGYISGGSVYACFGANTRNDETAHAGCTPTFQGAICGYKVGCGTQA